jgi:hypothetical protein
VIKSTPKSCSCQQCKRGKSTDCGHAAMRYDNRCNRHAAKTELDKLKNQVYNEDLVWDVVNDVTVPIGNYYD